MATAKATTRINITIIILSMHLTTHQVSAQIFKFLYVLTSVIAVSSYMCLNAWKHFVCVDLSILLASYSHEY